MASLVVTLVNRTCYPQAELAHKVGLWNPKGLKLTNSIGGLCYMLSGRPDFNGCRLMADGVEYTGEAIERWGAEHLPMSVALAREIRQQPEFASRFGEQPPPPPPGACR